MNIYQFRLFSRYNAVHNISNLVLACRRKFLKAACLVEIRNDSITKLHSFGIGDSIYVWPLLDPFGILSNRYEEEYITRQKNLFPNAIENYREKWPDYFNQIIIPYITNSDQIVRNVLYAVGGLPSKNPDQAALILSQFFTDMELPVSKPPWRTDDIFDINGNCLY